MPQAWPLLSPSQFLKGSKLTLKPPVQKEVPVGKEPDHTLVKMKTPLCSVPTLLSMAEGPVPGSWYGESE